MRQKSDTVFTDSLGGVKLKAGQEIEKEETKAWREPLAGSGGGWGGECTEAIIGNNCFKSLSGKNAAGCLCFKMGENN